MDCYGLIGKSLKHSYSKKYFTEKFKRENINAEYHLFELKTINQILELISTHPNLKGFTVTIPYKEEIIKFLDKIDDEAKEVAAVNTVKIIRKDNEFELAGYNTDVYGFEKSLTPYLKRYHKSALILGAGGASKAAAYVLSKLNISFSFVSRNENKGILYSQLNEDVIRNNLIIVNASPVGTYPETDNYPDIPYEFISSKHLIFDMVYNPPLTIFMEKSQKQGATALNGLKMLHHQADKAWKIFQG